MTRVQLSWFLSVPLLVACASASDLQALVMQRASFDLNCPASSLQITDLPGRAYGVVGCEQQASYVLTGDGCENPRSLGRREAQRYCTPVFDHGGPPGHPSHDHPRPSPAEPSAPIEPDPPVEPMAPIHSSPTPKDPPPTSDSPPVEDSDPASKAPPADAPGPKTKSPPPEGT